MTSHPGNTLTELDTTPASFTEDFQDAVLGIRGALTDLLNSAGADPAAPQEIARRFGVNRNLAWKISRIVNGDDAWSVAHLMPGSSGVEIFLKAMSKGGAASTAVEDTRRAVKSFDRMVEVHTGDRRTLEMMISSMGDGDLRERQEAQRRLAFEGNSTTWGVQATTQMFAIFISLNRDEPSMLDLVRIGGLVGFRRLRPDVRWPLFRRFTMNDDGTPVPELWQPLDPDYDDAGIPLLGEFCSRPVPEITSFDLAGERLYELPPGPVGNTASLTCTYGAIYRGFGDARRAEHNTKCEIACNMLTPVENVQIDLLIHESCDFLFEPDVGLYSRLDAWPLHLDEARERKRLPVHGDFRQIGRGVTSMASPAVPRYREMLGLAVDRLGLPGPEFRGFRYTLAFPPIPTMVIASANLPD